jgi:hypothetical protein
VEAPKADAIITTLTPNYQGMSSNLP